MMKWITLACSKIAMLGLWKLLNIPFLTIIKVFLGIYYAVKSHMPKNVEFPYEIVKKERKKFFN